MGQRRLSIRNRRVGVGLLSVAAIGTALLAPLATSSTPVGAATIDGARSLADRVAVQFKPSKTQHHRRASSGVERLPRQPRGHCRPEHLRPLRRWRGVVGQGCARQASAVRRQADQRHRRRQHRRQSACRRTLLRRAVDDRHQLDEGRLRLGRQPRVRQGLGPSSSVSRTAAAEPTSVAPPRPTRWPGVAPPTPTPAPISSTCRPTSCATTTARRCSPPSAPGRSRATAGGSSPSASSAKSSRQRPPSSPPLAWPASPSRTRQTPPTLPWRNSRPWA